MSFLQILPLRAGLRKGTVLTCKRNAKFSQSHKDRSYELDTIKNLRIGSDTRVIYQGFTGKVATTNARDSIAYGTNIVGGVSPGKGGTMHLGLPVFNTVKEAMSQVQPHATSVFVPAKFAAKAIIESIEAEVPLIVSVAEHIPVQDMLRVHEVLRTQTKSRLVGPNCPGIIAPEKCRIGIMPYKQYRKGIVGIVSKSGTLSYEAVGATTSAGLGQSLVVGMGGDMLPGTTLVDGLRVFFEHEETKGIIVIGEIGGRAEFEAAELIAEYNRKTKTPKPIIAMVAGRTAPKGKVMGHAGALLSPGEQGADAKAKALEAAGAFVVAHPGQMGGEMKRLLHMSDVGMCMDTTVDKLLQATTA